MEDDGSGAAARREGRFKMRERQWAYLGPILAAPIAHIAVSSYRHAKSPFQKYMIVGVGVVGSTVATLTMRVYLMGHSGFSMSTPGGEMTDQQAQERFREVDHEGKKEIEAPTWRKFVQQVARGFA